MMSDQKRTQIMAEATRLNFAVTPVQLPGAQEIRVMVQIGDIAGLSFTMLLTQDVARLLSKAIKEGVEKAEVTVIKPQSAIASA